ncbi:hypothetical protein JK361_07335 [Streptomyces sp. 5-8]|uniref:Uncharacterized protein n=1 Tax=Streptomyces musisoli TaxID=2802280 RepID=A0ABS1NWX2_9ACTN|nr:MULTISPECIES: hypothetical protein [Streptomyces]MBL1104415.1 hypothetical protein [Streptomyces musisoli]MBY8840388.1 hypothetical protein [Streptomyces sp. SP2-10]
MKAIAGLTGKHDSVLLIRDADLVMAALRQALADAVPEERPGLERAVALVESTAAATETRVRADWVRSRLSAVGFTGDIVSIAALKALRRAEPGLSLIAAVQLQKDAVAHPE